jgi:hypothetical protein
MGTFYYPLPSGNFKLISIVPDQPRAVILQVSSFRMSYFNNPWTLPSPSTSMEGTGHPSMSMPSSAAEVASNIVQQTLDNPDPTPQQYLDLVLEPIWVKVLLPLKIL